MNLTKFKFATLLSQFLNFLLILASNSHSEVNNFDLENAIEVVCIQNKNFEQSALVLIVDAGSNYDPKTHPGLSHLIEHLILNSPSESSLAKGIMSYIFGLSGQINGTTCKDIVKFNFEVEDKIFSEIAGILANSIANPSFNKSNCEQEIKILEHEFIRSKYDFGLKFLTILQSKLDPKYPESRFALGNSQHLVCDEIFEKVNSFIKDFYTGNRIKLAIASKMNMPKLRKIANLFAIIPKAKLKTGITYEIEINKNISFNDKYEVQTLNIPLKSIGYNSESAGSITRYYSKFSGDNTILIYILVPGIFSFFEYKFEKYLSYAIQNDWERLTASLSTKFKIPKENISHFVFQDIRSSKIIFEIKFEKTDENTVNLTLQHFHTFFHLLLPNEHVKNYLVRNFNEKFLESKNEAEIANLTAILLSCNVKKDFWTYYSSFSFDYKIFQSFFECLANIKNWCVFQMTDDMTGLTERDPIYFIRHSKTVKIKLENNYTEDIGKKNDLLKSFEHLIKPLPIITHFKKFESIPQKLKISENHLSEIDKIKAIIHKDFDLGEYTAINYKENDLLVFIVNLEIFANIPFNGNIDQDLSNSVYLERFAEETTDLIKEGVISVKDNTVTFRFKNSIKLLEAVQNFKTLLDSPIEYEILNNLQTAFNKKRSIFNNKIKSIQMFEIFKSIIKTDNFSISYPEKNRYPTSYYVYITAFGINADNLAEKCYHIIKSNDKTKMKILTNGKTFKTEITGVREERSRLIGLKIPEKGNAKALSMGLILKAIYNSRVFEALRIENKLTYEYEISAKIIRDNVFLIILINSTSSDQEIQEALKNEFLKYQKTIKATPDEHLEIIKRDELKHIFSNIKKIENFVNMAKDLKIYSLGFENKFKEIFKNITKGDLLELSLENYDPIIINEERKHR